MLPYPVIHQHGARFSIIPTSLWRALRGPAVYILGRDDGDHVARPLYVGETERLDGYLGPGHHKWQEALSHGMNVVCVHHDRRGAQFRRNLETILRRQYRPALNEPTVPAFPPNPLAGALAPSAEPPAPNPLAGSRS